MGQINQAINKIIPLSSWFQQIGLPEDVSQGLSILFVALFFWLVKTGVSTLLSRWRTQKISKDLKPQFDYLTVAKATKNFIPTYYQNVTPTRQEEPGFTHQYVARSPLISFFIKTAFNEKTDSERFYLILADSGMGKSTFMINLYIQYYSPFNWRRKHDMRLFRFSHPDTLNELKSIAKEEARNTILLLDALDEDHAIGVNNSEFSDSQAFQKRLDEIIEATRNFCEVVMTCRTQYFPDQEDDPYELKVKRPDEKGYYILNKLYLSPFTNKEVKRYLNKKYGYFPLLNRGKKWRAKRIVEQSHHLVVRPMMLSYIDFLAEEDLYYSDYKVYEKMVERWLIREAEKRKSIKDRPAFIDALGKASEEMALAMFSKWKEENRLYLTKEEAITIASFHNLELKPDEITGQSLLTCDGFGVWKFSHKSILEFFLAKSASQDPALEEDLQASNMDSVKRFLPSKRFIPEDMKQVIDRVLNEREATILKLYYEDELSQEEIATRFGYNPRAFKVLLYRILQRLRKELKKESK